MHCILFELVENMFPKNKHFSTSLEVYPELVEGLEE